MSVHRPGLVPSDSHYSALVSPERSIRRFPTLTARPLSRTIAFALNLRLEYRGGPAFGDGREVELEGLAGPHQVFEVGR